VLGNGSLTVGNGVAVPVRSQRLLLTLLDGSAAGASQPLADGLAPLDNPQARSAAARLASDLDGLLARPEGLQQAVISYNALVDASTDSFLREPSAEFLAVQSVLAVLVEDAFTTTASR
jgi:hypothetical protein